MDDISQQQCESVSYTLKESEVYMNIDMKNYFRSVLNGLKNQIMQTVDSTINNLRQAQKQYADALDLAAQEEVFQTELRDRDRQRKLLKNIERSLDWIDSGDYGYCEDCGSEIGVQRLQARPTAKMCFECKSLAELREKHIGQK